ncbi:hypothetical protein [Arsenicicoccus piscis]|uniref:hypothetical protein n=1 Tax=Arsenicicoccus piscis TaxID=673954 RepID=UPI0030C68DF9
MSSSVAIARALVNGPAILLADEPTGNLDPATSLEITALLAQINRRGTTVVMATHDDEIVNAMQRRVVELREGRVVRDQAHGRYQVALDLAEVAPEPEHADQRQQPQQPQQPRPGEEVAG